MDTFRDLLEKARGSKLKALVFVLVLTFDAALLLHQIKLPAADDLGRHIMNGGMILHGQFNVLYTNFYSYTEPNEFFANHHWLFGVISYVLVKTVGFGGIVIFKTLLLLSAFALLFFISLKRANFWVVATFSIPTILILMERTSFRPEIFSYFFIVFYLYFLHDAVEHPESNRIFWLIPLQIFWVNIHIFFVIGVALAGGFLFEAIIHNYQDIKHSILVKKLVLLVVFLAVASTINPQGIYGATLSFPLNIKGESPISIAEDVSLPSFLQGTYFWADVTIAIFVPLVILLMVSFLFGFKKKSPFYFLASTATAIVAYLHLRGLALFGLMFLPAISANFVPVYEKIEDFMDKKLAGIKKIVENLLVAILICILLMFTFFSNKIGITQFREYGIGLARWSDEGGRFFKEQGLKGPLFNDADVGSYLIYELYPETKVFVDNRFGDAYSPDFFRDDYLPAVADEEKWQEMQAKYQFESIFFYQYDAVTGGRVFLSRRMNDSEWALIYADTYDLIFIRNTAENQEKIAKFHITAENAKEKLSHLLQSDSAVDRVAGADIALLVGREDISMETYQDIVTKWPDEDSVWMVMAEIEIRKNNPQSSALAAMYLEKSLALGRKTAEVYSFLGLAYLRMEQLEKGKEMLEKALEINPERADAKSFLSQLDEHLKQKNITLQ